MSLSALMRCARKLRNGDLDTTGALPPKEINVQCLKFMLMPVVYNFYGANNVGQVSRVFLRRNLPHAFRP
jgi:hypothetical protein